MCSGLWGLPAELRILIYEFLFSDQIKRFAKESPDSKQQLQKKQRLSIGACKELLKTAFSTDTKIFDPPIFFTCHKIYEEARPVYIKIATFEFDTTDTLVAFLQDGQDHWNSISYIRVAGPGKTWGNALTAMACIKNIPIFRLLLKDVARGRENIEELLRALWVASYNGIQEMVKELLEKLPDAILEERGGYGIALFAAASQGHRTIVTLLLSRGIDSKGPSKCLCEQIPVAFRYRSDTCKKNTHGTAMEAASIGGHIEIVKLLLPTHLDHSDFHPALPHASRNGHIGIVKLLMPPVFKREEEFSYVLQAASRNGHTQIVKLLLQTGINSDETLGLCCSNALPDAAEKNHYEAVKLLLKLLLKLQPTTDTIPLSEWPEHGASPPCRTKIAETLQGRMNLALMLASGSGCEITVGLLLANGADVNALNRPSALLQASSNGHIGVVRLLVDNGAHVNYGDDRTPLGEALYYGHTEVASLLLQNGADVNVTGGMYGSGVRGAALGSGNAGPIQLLIGHGVGYHDFQSRDLLRLRGKRCKEARELLRKHVRNKEGMDLLYRVGQGSEGMRIFCRLYWLKIFDMLNKHSMRSKSPVNHRGEGSLNR